MPRDNSLRDPRVEPIEPASRPSDAYLHRAARMAVLLALPTLAAAGDWPRLRGPRSARVGVERALPSAPAATRNLAWRKDIPAGISSLVAAEGRVFLAGEANGAAVVVCLEAHTGEEIWRRTLDASPGVELRIDRPPSGAMQLIAVDATNVTAFAPETGETLWTNATPAPDAGAASTAMVLVKRSAGTAGPAFHEGRLYLRSGNALSCYEV